MATLSDADGSEIQVRVCRQQRDRNTKTDCDDPFGVTDAIDLTGLSEEMCALAATVFGELVDFDTNQLGAMRGRYTDYATQPRQGSDE